MNSRPIPRTDIPARYIRFAIVFFVISMAILCTAWFLTWSGATIIVSAKTSSVKEQLTFDVRPGATPSTDPQLVIPGMVTTTPITVTESFKSSGTGQSRSDIVGEVTIVNTSSKDQILIATTRLASQDDPDKILVRLKNQVTAPANKSVTVAVYADNTESFEELKPMRFIIPGLWKPLQEKIYAQSHEILTSGGVNVSVVTADDIKNAQNLLKQEANTEAVEVFGNMIPRDQALWPKLVSSSITSVSFDVKEGDAVPSFTGTMTAAVSVVSFDESQLVSLVRSKIRSGSSEILLRDINPRSLSYELESVRSESSTVKADIEGDSITSDVSGLIDVVQLTGKSREEAMQILGQLREVEVNDIVLRPAWLTHLPSDPNRISVKFSAEK